MIRISALTAVLVLSGLGVTADLSSAAAPSSASGAPGIAAHFAVFTRLTTRNRRFGRRATAIRTTRHPKLMAEVKGLAPSQFPAGSQETVGPTSLKPSAALVLGLAVPSGSSSVSAGPGPAASVTLVPSSDGACLVVSQPGSDFPGSRLISAESVTCADATQLIDNNGMSDVTSDGGGTYVAYGLVPNGNRTVRLTTASGQTISTPVVDNMYFADFDQRLRRISYRGVDGRTTTRREP